MNFSMAVQIASNPARADIGKISDRQAYSFQHVNISSGQINRVNISTLN